MGGTWLPVDSATTAPILWHYQIPTEVSHRLVSSSNPTVSLTNLDLEHLALVCHPDILAAEHDIREQTICLLSSNTAAVSREHRGSTSTNSPSAYLCRLAALHQCENCYRLTSAYLPGVLNVMADNASRRWDLNDSQLLAYFNSTYPQKVLWQLYTFRPAVISSAMQALSMQHSDPACLLAEIQQQPQTGPNGKVFVNNLTWALLFPIQQCNLLALCFCSASTRRPAFCLQQLCRSFNSGVSCRFCCVGAHNGWTPQPASHSGHSNSQPTPNSSPPELPKGRPSAITPPAHPD
jgi:hypothetical protein